jgi:putative transposase
MPFISKEIKPRLHAYLRTLITNEGANLLFINGIEDHVHLLLAAPATLLVPDLIEKIKPLSTKWVRKTFPELRDFAWQEGYAGFTVAKSILPNVIKYIQNQEEHHKKISFKQEYLQFLTDQGISFDVDHVFD